MSEESTDTSENRQAGHTRIADLLSSACGGGTDIDTNTSEWDAERFAEHIHQRTSEIVTFIFERIPEAEELGQPYGDAFDTIEAALYRLWRRSLILDRLVDGGRVTECEIDEAEAKLETEVKP